MQLNEETTVEKTGYLSPEFIAEREEYWVKSEGPVLGGCGDDRAPITRSAEELSVRYPEAMDSTEGFASIYGGAAGIAKNIIVTGIVQYGPTFVDKIGGFSGALDKVMRIMSSDTESDAVIPVLHSAEGNENPDGTFCDHGDAATGCAYCGGVGATSGLLVDANAPLTRNVARADQDMIFGSDRYVDALLDAHQTFLDRATASAGTSFSVGRDTFIDYRNDDELQQPVMVLAGKHVDAQTSGTISNYDLGEVGNPSAAHSDGKDFYRLDIARMTAAVQRNFREYDLDPEILMRAFQLDSTPVRTVLGGGDPRNLAAGYRGDVRTTLELLRARR